MSGVNGDIGQAAMSNKPDAIERINEERVLPVVATSGKLFV